MFFQSTGYQTTMIGGVLLLFFYLRRQEAGVRNDINTSLQRLQKDKELLEAQIKELQAELDQKESEIDKVRRERREAEDTATRESRRADLAELRLKQREGR